MEAPRFRYNAFAGRVFDLNTLTAPPVPARPWQNRVHSCMAVEACKIGGGGVD